jgi:hypothetical protein
MAEARRKWRYAEAGRRRLLTSRGGEDGAGDDRRLSCRWVSRAAGCGVWYVQQLREGSEGGHHASVPVS